MKKKKSIAVTALLIAAVMLVSACGSNNNNNNTTNSNETSSSTTSTTSNDSTSATNSNDTASTDTTNTGDTDTASNVPVTSEPYVTYFQQDYGTLNYFSSNKSVDAEEGTCHFVDALIQNDKFGALAPDIALSWEQNADATVWTLKLRDDVKWVRSDGSEYATVTAHDFVAGGKYILDPNVGSVTVDFWRDFIKGAKEYYADNSLDFSTVGVKALDDFTLEYTMISPTTFFPSLLTYTCYLPVSQAFLDEIGPENFGLSKDNILYNGSYILESWEKDVSRRLVKNEKYFDADRVHVPYIEYFSIPEGTVAVELYKRGEISAAGIGTAQLDEIMNDPEYTDHLYVTNPTSASYAYSFNTNSPDEQFNTAALNKNFRFAMFHAFDFTPLLMLSNPYDQSKMNSGLYSAHDISVLPDGRDYVSLGRLPELEQRNLNNYNVDKAREYMAKAKEELGSSVSWPLTVRILGTAAEASERQSAVIKQVFEDAFPGDIIIETTIYTSDTYYQIMDEGNYNFTSAGWSADYADPSAYLATVIPGHDWDFAGFGNYPEMAEYVKVFNEAMSITNDLEARYEKFAEAEAILYDNCILIPFRYAGGNYAINKIQNPYEALRSGYGLSATKFIDRIYGTVPLTKDQREEQRAKYEQEKAALGH